ncbi:MAG: cysteine--tRNA ligase [Candidatus Omnitrophica bacterium 4484_213]|nr:MAG: cysteine--tRNA ligase [Candidatus Omnitrophica bacterium 4484_213]
MLCFYNTLSRRKEKFTALKKGIVKIYSCGPTVYDFAHIGNFRAYVFEDLLRRYLKYKGYRVLQVMNITDVDDKTIAGAKREAIKLSDFTKRYTDAFFEDLEKLNIERVEEYPRATEHISEMVKLIKVLLKKGFAYEKDGSIYFQISQFKEYGKLSGKPLSDTQRPTWSPRPAAGEQRREDADEYDKENPADFVLWKKVKEDEPSWPGPGKERGRPGWHIECSAMSMKYLGESFDIHTGGEDNIFPHHENEIAQSEAATGKKFVNYWLHCKFLLVNNEKMSKSKGNFFTLRDLLERGYDPLVIRFLLLSTHYRHSLNFTLDGLRQAKQTLKKLSDFYLNIKSYLHTRRASKLSFKDRVRRAKKDFEKAMDDDLNISSALAALFDLIKDINKAISEERIGESDLREAAGLIEKINSVLGILKFDSPKEIDEEERRLIEQREEARRKRNFELADRIREELKKRGIILEDTKDGGRWRKSLDILTKIG